MSKLLDLLAQQKMLEAQIESLKADASEAKVLKLVEELDALRDKHGYTEADFVAVVLSYYKVETPAKTRKSVSEKTTKAKAPKFKVMIDGVETILQSKKAGAVGAKIEKLGFSTYAEYLTDLIKKNKVADFDALIKKLNGVPV